jgi:hypothetical protein
MVKMQRTDHTFALTVSPMLMGPPISTHSIQRPAFVPSPSFDGDHYVINGSKYFRHHGGVFFAERSKSETLLKAFGGEEMGIETIEMSIHETRRSRSDGWTR